MDTPKWRTGVTHPLARALGLELHAVFFEPFDDSGGARPCTLIQVPEASESETQHAFTMAAKLATRVVIVCDTAQQAADIAQRATAALPLHRRVAIERAQARAIGRVV